MEQLLIVLSNAHAGKDAEFNEWYSYVHVRDVMRLSPRAIAVQRFGLAATQFPDAPTPDHRYLAVYEGDVHSTFTEGHADVFTPAMPISSTFRFDDVREAYYEPLAAQAKVTDRAGKSDIIVERFGLGGGETAFEKTYMETRLPQIMRLPGVTEGVFSRVAAEQMLKPHADSHYIALYRTNNLSSTLQTWTTGGVTVTPSPAEMVQRGCYTPLMLRLTATAARFPSLPEAERAAAARAALGESVYVGFPEEMRALLAS